MRRAGGLTQAKKVDRLYKNLRAEYKLYVCLTDATDLADRAKQAAEFEEITKAQESESRIEKRRSTPLPPRLCRTTETPPFGNTAFYEATRS